MPGPTLIARARGLAVRGVRLVGRAALAPLLGSAPFAEAEQLRREADALQDQVTRLELRLGEVLVELQAVADRMEGGSE